MAKRRGNGEGSVYKRKSDGKWVASITLDTVGGKTRRHNEYADTKVEARELLAKLQRAKAAGLQIGSERERISVFLDRWLRDVVTRRVRPTTHELYASVVRTHLTPAFGHLQLGKLMPHHVQTFLNRLADAGSHRTSIITIRNIFRLAINHAVRQQILTRNVVAFTDIPIAKVSDPLRIDLDLGQQVLDAAEGTSIDCLVATALHLGLRRGELLGLRWNDIDMTEHKLYVRQAANFLHGAPVLSAPKTASSVRDVPIPPLLMARLHAHRARQLEHRLQCGTSWTDLDLVFPGPGGLVMEPSVLHRVFKRVLRSAGLPSELTLHGLRHAFASFMAAAKADPKTAMETMGHSELRTTLGIYTHSSEEQKRSALVEVSEMLARRKA